MNPFRTWFANNCTGQSKINPMSLFVEPTYGERDIVVTTSDGVCAFVVHECVHCVSVWLCLGHNLFIYTRISK